MASTTWLGGRWERAKEMLDAGKSLKEAAAAVGVEAKTLKHKVRYHQMGAEEKQRRALRQREYRKHYLRTGHSLARPSRSYEPMQTPARLQFERPAPKPDAKLIAERDYRLSLAPRDLTAQLLGDPPPGYSALDQKRLCCALQNPMNASADAVMVSA